jgi:hypothetical protein
MSSQEVQAIEEEEVLDPQEEEFVADEAPEEAPVPAAEDTATRWTWPEGFPKERSKELQSKVSKAYRSLSAAKHNGKPLQNVQANYRAAVQARQAAVDGFLQQQTVKKVNEHTTEEVDRCIRETSQNVLEGMQKLLGDRKRKAPPSSEASASVAASPSLAAASPPAAAAPTRRATSSGTKKCQFCDERFGTDRGLATHMTRSHKDQKPAKKPRGGYNAEILKKYKKDRVLKEMLLPHIWAGLGEVEDPDEAALAEGLDKLVESCSDLVRQRGNAPTRNQCVVLDCWCITVGRLQEEGKPFPLPTIVLEGLVSAMSEYIVKTEPKAPQPVVCIKIE